MPELWDLYEKDRRPLGRAIPRGEPLPEGTYHLAVGIAVLNRQGEILLTQRSPEKDPHGGCWEIPGGCAQAGETSLAAACRELQEETGLAVLPEELILLLQEVLPGVHLDIYAATREEDKTALRLQDGETEAAQWPPLEEWLCRVGQGTYLTPSWYPEPDLPLYPRLREYRRGKRNFDNHT